jgi:hypothetical protein
LIIGAQKSATRWLRTNLGEHPEVFAASIEVSFFNQRFNRGTDFYRSQFEGWNGEPIVGEATPGYMMWRHRPRAVARRIHETIPDVRLIALLRNPIDRAQSAMVHHIKKERLPRRPGLLRTIEKKPPEEDRLGLVAGGWYAASLEPYLKRFGDQLLVIFHDEVTTDPGGVYRRSLEHIGASTDFVPPEIEQVVFSNQQRSTPRRRSSLSDDDRVALWPYFRDDVQRLESMVGRDLSAWDPTPGRLRWPVGAPDLLALYDQVTHWLSGLIEATPPELYQKSTERAELPVRELIVRIISKIYLCSSQLIDGSQWRAEAGSPADALGFAVKPVLDDRADDAQAEIFDGIVTDPASAFASGSGWLREVAESKSQLTVPDSDPPVPAAMLLAYYLAAQTANGWDLALATGQEPELPAEVVRGVDEVVTLLFELLPQLRGLFGDEIAAPATADDTTRLLGRLGRDDTRSLRVS